MFNRQLSLLKSNSFFLFGARGTGKTTLVKQTFTGKEAYIIDLLDPEPLSTIQANPGTLMEMVEHALGRYQWIIIDEVQKVPQVLDIVHHLMESRKVRFGLTGSSVRKLRRGASNLLAGRAFVHSLFPLTPGELKDRFHLDTYLAYGGLPKIFELKTEFEKKRFLSSYVETYLQEEVVAEQVIRKLPPFRRFLQIAAQSNGRIVNYRKIAEDIQSDPVSVKSYYQILEDTLIGMTLNAFQLSVRKRQRQNPKFYLFDTGVVRAQAKQLDMPVNRQTYEYGRLFESFIVNLIRVNLEYQFRQFQLSYLLTKDGAEIDLILECGGEKTALIEIKSGKKVSARELNNLNRFARDIPNSKAYCFYNGSLARKIGSVSLLPWRQGLEELGIGKTHPGTGNNSILRTIEPLST